MSGDIALPLSFQISYNQRGTYPRNLIHRTVSTYPSALAAYALRLDEAAPLLFVKEVDEVVVAIRDLQTDNGEGLDLHKLNILAPEELTNWFGINKLENPLDALNPLISVQRKDPKCRFIYIYGIDPRARLQLTRPMLEEILTFHQVMPDYLDFLRIFGLQSDAKDLRFSSYREQKTLREEHPSIGIENLGRSGRQYQMCYNLKGVTVLKGILPRDWDFWDVRQAAFYHRFDIVGGNTLWIVTKGKNDLQQRYKELTGKDAKPEHKDFATLERCFRSSLSVHLLFCYWSTENWRECIQYWELTIERKTKFAILIPTNKTYKPMFTARDVQYLLHWTEQVRDIITHIRSNIDVICCLQRFYLSLLQDENFPLRQSCAEDINIFVSQLTNLTSDFRLQIDRADAILCIARDRAELVKARRVERLNSNLESEAIIVRIITIVTLFYLPATFVSTFFSTDIVKYQGNGKVGETFSTMAMLRWLEVTVPLMVLTMGGAWMCMRWAEGVWEKEVYPMVAEDLTRSTWLPDYLQTKERPGTPTFSRNEDV